jgi:hypothetical protein
LEKYEQSSGGKPMIPKPRETLPFKAGWLLATLLILVLALTSYMTASWVIEAMAACNGLLLLQERTLQHQIGRRNAG